MPLAGVLNMLSSMGFMETPDAESFTAATPAAVIPNCDSTVFSASNEFALPFVITGDAGGTLAPENGIFDASVNAGLTPVVTELKLPGIDCPIGSLSCPVEMADGA